MEFIYSVYEKYEDDDFIVEYFGKNREGAIQYLTQRKSEINGIYKNWNKQFGINHFKWIKDYKFIELYLKIIEVERRDSIERNK